MMLLLFFIRAEAYLDHVLVNEHFSLYGALGLLVIGIHVVLVISLAIFLQVNRNWELTAAGPEHLL